MNKWLCIDGSYFVFYRVHATLNWWKLAKKESYDAVKDAPHLSPEFVEKFHDFCDKSIQKVAKLHGVGRENIIIAKDCPRADIWRMEFYPEYKGTRKSSGAVGGFFELFYSRWAGRVLYHPHLEADDCIARFVKSKGDDDRVIIIASDNDYLQLVTGERVQLWDLANKNLGEKRTKSTAERPNFDIFAKVVNGDVSDNIPPVFGKAVTAKKLVSLYDDWAGEINSIVLPSPEGDMLLRNLRLICFDYIPDIYQI
jgi:5'-3' exonuclease